MRDEQVDDLIEVLKDGRIIAVDVGKTKHVTRDAVIRLNYALKDTKLGFIFVEVLETLSPRTARK